MKVAQTHIPGVLIFEPQVFQDARGFFLETWNRQRYEAAGITDEFTQDNLSASSRGVLRGLHYQLPHLQGKLVYVLQGEVFDVAVDIRVGSPTFGEHVAVTLSAENRRQFYIPAGFAHGFCVVSDTALFAYKCTDSYYPEEQCGIRYDDPDLAIPWPVADPLLSPKDEEAPYLKDVAAQSLPRITG